MPLKDASDALGFVCESLFLIGFISVKVSAWCDHVHGVEVSEAFKRATCFKEFSFFFEKRGVAIPRHQGKAIVGGLGVDAFVESACVGEGVAGFESKGGLVKCVIGFGVSGGEFVDVEELFDGLKGLTALEQGLGGAHPVDQDKCFDTLPEEFFGLGGGGGGDGCEQGRPVVGLSEDLEGLHLCELGFGGVREGLDHQQQSAKALSEGLFALKDVGLLDQCAGGGLGVLLEQRSGRSKDGREGLFLEVGVAPSGVLGILAMALPEAHLAAQEIEACMIEDLCGRCGGLGGERRRDVGGGIGRGGDRTTQPRQGRQAAFSDSQRFSASQGRFLAVRSA